MFEMGNFLAFTHYVHSYSDRIKVNSVIFDLCNLLSLSCSSRTSLWSYITENMSVATVTT